MLLLIIIHRFKYLSCSRSLTALNSALLEGTGSMLHLRARYFPTQDVMEFLRVISLTFRRSLINFTNRKD